MNKHEHWLQEQINNHYYGISDTITTHGIQGLHLTINVLQRVYSKLCSSE